MEPIKVENNPEESRLNGLGVFEWPIWTKEVSSFPPVRIGKGDLVTFASGLSCTWEIHAAVRKHYTLG